MTETDTKMQEYGYYEVYVPVWNPETQSRPVNMTVDVYGDEETLKSINTELERAVVEYGQPQSDQEMSYFESIFIDYFAELVRQDLIMEMYCKEFAISSVNDYKERKKEPGFAFFPL